MRHLRADPAAADASGSGLAAEALPAERPPLSGAGAPGSIAPVEEIHNRVGSGRYLLASGALLLAGFATFSLLYCAQPLLPTLARIFGVGAAASSPSR